MSEEFDILKSTIPGIHILLEVTVPRWAADEPMPGEPIPVAPIPPLSEEGLHIEAAHWYTGYAPSSTIKSDLELDMDLPVSEVQLSESIYDKAGYLIENRKFDHGAVAQHERYSYDESHRLLARDFDDPVDELSETEVRSYDFQGRTSSKSVTGADDITLTTSYQWSGSEVLEITSGPDGIESRIHKVFDNVARIIECKEFDSDDRLVSGEARTYTESGKLEELWTIEDDGSRWRREFYEHDSDDREIRWSEMSKDGSTTQQRDTMYEAGRCEKDILYEIDNETTTTYEYDSSGRLTRTVAVSDTSEIESVHAYEANGLPAMTATRMIKDKRSNFRRGITPGASTTWWVYEFQDA